MPIQIKRIYEPVQESDGIRLLVDRLWPRGISKEKAHIDGWAKELAPSNELRTWFGHEATKFIEFAKLYKAELKANTAAQKSALEIIRISREKPLLCFMGRKTRCLIKQSS
ncbi:MAG: hypothetical protein BWY62_01299 [Firmicutes bacterium ADurb.Bin356]|nr:MAG: hypothetical protein BWY62_01299 [Firmicutes bacterium ADurb.Bin356]